jgi:hypothetical protein
MFWFMQKKFVGSYLAFNHEAVVFVAIGGLEPVVVPMSMSIMKFRLCLLSEAEPTSFARRKQYGS